MSCLFGVLALTLAAQAGPIAPRTTVEGEIRDAESGAPLAGAVIVLADLDRAVVSDGDGRYSLTSVPAGPQHLVIRRIGYRSRTLHVLVPSDGRLEVNLSLRPDPIRLDRVSADPGRPVRGLEPDEGAVFPDRGITHAALRHHPTLAQSDPLQGLAGGEVLVEPEAPAGLHVRGGAADHTGFLLDGVPVLSPYHTAGLFSAWNPDALAGLAIAAAAPSPALPDALSGAVVARTKQPGTTLRMHSAVSNTEARATLDGPIAAGASYLLSWRLGLTGPLAPGDEASYLAGETGDIVGTVRTPVLGGVLQLLVYDSENELAPASAVPGEDGSATSPPNRFEWSSRSMGAGWAGSLSPALTARVGGWRASADAHSRWLTGAVPATVASSRDDFGFQAALEHRSNRIRTEAGLRARSTRTTYRVNSTSPVSWDADGSVAVFTAFGQHARPLTDRSDVWAGLAASQAGGEVLLSPRASVRLRPAAKMALFAAYSRTHQFAQSLRNPESVVGHIFPADLAVASGGAVVPVAESDQVVLAGELALQPGLRVGAQAFDRRLRRLLLVAPVEPGPFATSAFVIGSATARGASLELAASGARHGLVVSYGLQRVRVSYGDSLYTPRHGTTHTLDAGLTVHPAATFSIRLGVAAAMGRTSTTVSGPFEWESCNVLDRGCEFAGSPQLLGPLGADRLPTYARVDLGGRKHWHARVAGRDMLIGVFGTVSNVLGRHNALVHVVDPETGERQTVDMLPRAPLIIGIDTRF